MSSQAIIEKEKLDNFEDSLPTCESLTFLSAAAIVLLVMTTGKVAVASELPLSSEILGRVPDCGKVWIIVE